MATNFPTSLDTTTNLPDPVGTDLMENTNNNLDHAQQHNTENDAMAAVEARLGITRSTVTSSLDWRMRNAPNPPRTANAMDDEFDATSLDAKWTWFQQTITAHTATATFANGSLLMTFPSPYAEGDKARTLTQAVPAGDWVFETCVTQIGNRGATTYTGLVVSSSGNAQHEVIARKNPGAASKYIVLAATKLTSVGAFSADYKAWNMPHADKLYLRIERSSTTLNFYWSIDGNYFELFETHSETTYLSGGASRIGIMMSTTNFSGTAIDLISTFEYFRRIS